MPILVEDALKRGGSAGALLHGSDVASKRQIVVKVKEVREAPDGFNSPIIVDIEPVAGKTAWAMNKTNIKAAAKVFKLTDLAKLKGKKIKLDVISTRNPKNGEIVPSLAVALRQ